MNINDSFVTISLWCSILNSILLLYVIFRPSKAEPIFYDRRVNKPREVYDKKDGEDPSDK